MKILSDKNFTKKLLSVVGVSVLIGTVSLFLILLIMSLVTLNNGISDNGVITMSTIALMISAFISGLISSKLSNVKKLPIAVLSGLSFYIIVAIVSMIVSNGTIGSLFLLRMIFSVLSSSLGAIVGTVKKQKSII